MEYKISDSPVFKEKFAAKHVPNVGVWPGWFSDGRFHNSYLQNVSFDANERRLNIEVIKDKSQYKPGESVTLGLRVTDKDSRPVVAEVNLSALDEAIFSLKPQEKDVVNDLYRDIYSQVIIRTSHEPPYGGGGAEKGGGDGDGVRSDINEMALWKSLSTDSSGRARVEFKLPENITSWRLTSQAVTKDLYAGKSVDFIKVTLPFFVDVVHNKTYLEGDEPIFRARAFGTTPQKNVLFSAESDTLPFKKIEK